MSTSRTAGGGALPSLEVVVIEADPDARAHLVALLRTFRLRAREARGVGVASRIVRLRRPHLILADVHLPGIKEWARRLREDPRDRGILLVAMSWLGRPIDLALGHLAGFDGYVSKPVGAKALARILDRAWDRRGETREDRHLDAGAE